MMVDPGLHLDRSRHGRVVLECLYEIYACREDNIEKSIPYRIQGVEWVWHLYE